MLFKIPKDDERYRWTNHVVRKMTFYGLSPDRVKRVIRAPQRMEVGIAENTLAGMQVAGSKKNPSEIWVMYAEKRNKRQETGDKEKVYGMSLVSGRVSLKVIITAWRYPGVSPVRDEIPIPANILAELKKEKLI